jgi:hypothetical protein
MSFGSYLVQQHRLIQRIDRLHVLSAGWEILLPDWNAGEEGAEDEGRTPHSAEDVDIFLVEWTTLGLMVEVFRYPVDI